MLRLKRCKRISGAVLYNVVLQYIVLCCAVICVTNVLSLERIHLKTSDYALNFEPDNRVFSYCCWIKDSGSSATTRSRG